MTDDTASSLRAAALLSLKSKQMQRRGAPAPSPWAQQTEAVSLIYDESPQAPPVASSSSPGDKKPMDIDDANADLEDGEISDSNNVQPEPLVESQPAPPESATPQSISAKVPVSRHWKG